MQPQIPGGISNQDVLNKSVNKVLSGNVSPGSGLTFDVNGQPLTYATDNVNGVMVRIGGGAPASWPAANTDLTIAHNLGVKPYGFIITAKNMACDVYWGSIQPTDTNITLRCTAVADTTILILAGAAEV